MDSKGTPLDVDHHKVLDIGSVESVPDIEDLPLDELRGMFRTEKDTLQLATPKLSIDSDGRFRIDGKPLDDEGTEDQQAAQNRLMRIAAAIKAKQSK